jgi:hypothetical protein
MIEIQRKSATHRFEQTLGRVAQQQVDLAADRIVTGARERVPVQTGSLRDSIEAHDAGIHAAVVQAGGGGHTRPDGKPVDYAAVIELGGAKRAPKPFLRPAAIEEAPRFPKELREALKNAL